MKVQKLFVVAAAVAALVLGMFMPLNVSAQDKVYELSFAWNDIWGPKFRASPGVPALRRDATHGS